MTFLDSSSIFVWELRSQSEHNYSTQLHVGHTHGQGRELHDVICYVCVFVSRVKKMAAICESKPSLNLSYK